MIEAISRDVIAIKLQLFLGNKLAHYRGASPKEIHIVAPKRLDVSYVNSYGKRVPVWIEVDSYECASDVNLSLAAKSLVSASRNGTAWLLVSRAVKRGLCFSIDASRSKRGDYVVDFVDPEAVEGGGVYVAEDSRLGVAIAKAFMAAMAARGAQQ